MDPLRVRCQDEAVTLVTLKPAPEIVTGETSVERGHREHAKTVRRIEQQEVTDQLSGNARRRRRLDRRTLTA